MTGALQDANGTVFAVMSVNGVDAGVELRTRRRDANGEVPLTRNPGLTPL